MKHHLRITAALGVIVIAVACVPPPEPVPDASAGELEELEDLDLPSPAATSVMRRAQEITVRIRTLGCRQFGVGSGFVLPGGIVVTNRHVVDEPREVTLNTWDGRSLDAEVRGLAVSSDLAMLRLADDAGLPVAELRETPVEVGEPIIVVGYPGGGPATVVTGTVLGHVSGELLDEATEVLRIDAEIRQGNSGGPVLDQQGRVVGVVFALEVGRGTGLAVPATTLISYLEGAPMAEPAGC
ncbi:MAG: serine protease [Nitriliruptoraceae bacterium]